MRTPNTQFIVLPENVGETEFVLVGEEARHAASSLRVRDGSIVVATDGLGKRYEGVVSCATRRRVRATISRVIRGVNEPTVRVALCQAMMRGGRMDTLVEKATECGVARVVPTITKRSEVSPRSGGSRTERWSRIARAATKQCMRSVVPVVEGPTPFDDAVSFVRGHDIGLIALAGDSSSDVRSALSGRMDARRVALLVGPEGGFTREEAEHALDRGWTAVRLGSRRLRSETAGIVMLVAVMSALGELE
jgi:16S rRNA (uracil1498-N3)-methyltransferase